MRRKRLQLLGLGLLVLMVVSGSGLYLLGWPNLSTQAPPHNAGSTGLSTPHPTIGGTSMIPATVTPDHFTVDQCFGYTPPNSPPAITVNFGDLAIKLFQPVASMTHYQLPAGLPQKPLVLPADYASTWFSPTNPSIPRFAICNTARGKSHILQSISMRLIGFSVYTGQLYQMPECGPFYVPSFQAMAQTNCDPNGTPQFEDSFHVTLPNAPTIGTTATATQDGAAPSSESMAFGYWPLQLLADQSTRDAISFLQPQQAGYYQFALSFTVDNQTSPYFPLFKYLWAPPAQTWSGNGCLNPAMLQQIPPTSKDEYVCPEN